MFKFIKNKGDISFGAEVVIFIILLFFIWYIIGDKNSETIDKPFIKENNITNN